MLLRHKKEQNNAICSNVDGPRDYHTERNQTEKDKCHIISLIKGNLKKGVQMNLSAKQKYSHRCRKQTNGYHESSGGKGINWEIGIDIYMVLYIK